MKQTRRFGFLGLLILATSPLRADSLESAAKRLAKTISHQPSKRVAVLSFPYHNGDVSSGSSIVAEKLTTLLVQDGRAEVVERALLDKAMSEIKLGMTGALDSSTTQKLGKVLSVSAIVTGTLIDLENSETEVNARLIQTETGSILAAASAHMDRTWQDLPRPPQPAPEAKTEEETGSLHMSKLIPVSSPRRRFVAPVYNGPMDPTPSDTLSSSKEDVLTLTNDDLVPVNHRGQTDPQRIVTDFLADDNPPSPSDLRIARRIYHRNPDPQVRARALLAMGHILERSGRPHMAAEAYDQVLREFPESPDLQNQARQRLQQDSSQ